MLRLIWNLSVGLRNALHRFAPTNILSDAIRTRRRGLKWGVPAMLLAGPYLYLAYICTVLIDEGGPAWLSLLVLLFIWNAMKMLWIGPVSLVVLIRVIRPEFRSVLSFWRMDSCQDRIRTSSVSVRCGC